MLATSPKPHFEPESFAPHHSGKLIGCALLEPELVLDLELCPHVWKRLAMIDLSPIDVADFDEAEYNSLLKLRHIEDEGVDEEVSGACRLPSLGAGVGAGLSPCEI